jgi:glycosyltransferase involved in cell wall biosynthesis
VSERTLLSIVIPTYSEQANVPRSCERLVDVLHRLDVDAEITCRVDPSTDRTEQVASPSAQLDETVGARPQD